MYMNYKAIIGASIAGLMIPAGMALAESSVKGEARAEGHIFQNNQSDLEFNVKLRGVADLDRDGRLDVVGRIHGDADMDDDNDGVNDQRGKKDEKRAEAARKESGEGRDESSIKNDDHRGFGKGGLPGQGIRSFVSFFFGLPASTTVGELRAQLAATTSTDISKSQGLGFWGRIFGAFRLSHDN